MMIKKVENKGKRGGGGGGRSNKSKRKIEVGLSFGKE